MPLAILSAFPDFAGGGGTFTINMRQDGFSRTMLGNIPFGIHTTYVLADGYLDVRTGGFTDVPAMVFHDEGESDSPVAGALERDSSGELKFTTHDVTRQFVVLSTNKIYAHTSGTNVWFSTDP